MPAYSGGWERFMKRIGFIGVGIMGKSMVRNLMKHGIEVAIYARTKEKVLDVLSEGALWCSDIAECVSSSEAVITIVGFPNDVEEVYFGEGGILSSARPGTFLIDMTTTSPKLAIRIYEEAKKAGLHALDAPVTGGDTGAKAGTLTIMAGGDEEDFEVCLPILKAMGKNIVYQGGPGSGQHTKMCNQIVIAGTLSAICEAMTYAKAEGLDVGRMMKTIGTGAAGSKQLENVAPRILDGDYAPGFFIKHFIKDMGIADEEAKEAGLTLPVLEKVLSMYREMEAEGKGDLGTQALIQYYETML